MNLLLPPGSGDEPFMRALQTACERIAAYAPDGLVVSLGVDGHEQDPSAGLAISFDGYRRAGARQAEPGLPMVLVQEGGYNNETIGQGVASAPADFEENARK